MRGGNYLLYQGPGRGDRSDSHHDRRYDGTSRNYRDRGGYRGRGYDTYRGGYRGRDHGRYRDPRDRDPRDRDLRDRDLRDRDPRDRDPRDRDVRDRGPRDRDPREREPRDKDLRDVRENDPRDRAPRERESREDRKEREDRRDDKELRQERPERPERPDMRERHDRSERKPFRGAYRDHSYRERGSDTPAHRSGSAVVTPGERSSMSVSKFSDPWISILRIGEGKTAARMDATYKEVSNVNKTIAELQADAMKLSALLSMLEVYALRDALNVEITNEKLDEFTYM